MVLANILCSCIDKLRLCIWERKIVQAERISTFSIFNCVFLRLDNMDETGSNQSKEATLYTTATEATEQVSTNYYPRIIIVVYLPHTRLVNLSYFSKEV